LILVRSFPIASRDQARPKFGCACLKGKGSRA
jgi:hypothetical protein